MNQQWHAPFAKIAIWDGRDPDSQKPALAFVDPMLRRRLSPLARAVFQVAHECNSEAQQIPVVYASRHGELDRTIELLTSIANNEALSPTAFSLSVLHTNVGLHSIALRNTAPATAIAAGTETFGFGLLEATSQAAASKKPVLYLYGEAPVPPPLESPPQDVTATLAIAMLIDPTAKQRIEYTFAVSENAADDCSQAYGFLSFLEQRQDAIWNQGKRTWHWKSTGVHP